MGKNISYFQSDSQGVKTNPLPNNDVERFLDLLDPRGQFTFQTFADSRASGAFPTVIHGTLEQHMATLERLNRRGSGVFVTVNSTDGQGRKASNIIGVRAIFVDLDGAELQPVRDGPLPPHIITETSPGKWHAYWLIDHCDLEHFGFIQKELARRFGGDPKVCDLPRVMRLPGFLHQKGEPFLSRLIRAESGRYALKELLKAFKITLPERKQSPEPTRKASHAECSDLLSNHLNAIRNAVPGTRNDTLNKRAFFIGGLVAAGAASVDEALQEVLTAAAEAGIDGASYTANRALKEGIQKGSYRIPAPPPHFPMGETLPPVEARAELSRTVLNVINQAEDWKFLQSEIKESSTEIRNLHGNPKKTKTPSPDKAIPPSVEYWPSKEEYLACQRDIRRARLIILKRLEFIDTTHAPRNLLRVSAGTGKTTSAIEAVLNSDDLEFVLAYFPTVKKAEEEAAKKPGLIKAIRGRCESNCSQHIVCQMAGERGLPVYSTFCEMKMKNMASIKCTNFKQCQYLEQFENTGEKIIALSHEYLKLDTSLLRGMGEPKLHIIDESIIGIVAGTINFQRAVLPVDFQDMQPGDDAQARAIARGWTLEDVTGYRAMCFSDMQNETLAGAKGLRPGIPPERAFEILNSITNTGAAQRWRFFSTLAAQWELGKGAEAIRIGTKPISVDGKIEQQLRVFVSFKRELAGLREGEPVLLLDADGNIDVNRALVAERMQEHRIDAARNVLVVQVATSGSKTALGLPEGTASSKLTRISKQVRDFIPSKKVVTTYKDAKTLADFGLPDENVNHFGGFLGKNDWKNHNTAIIAGRNLMPCEALEDLNRAIYLNSLKPLNLLGRYVLVMQGYTMRDGSQRGAMVQAHPDPRVNSVLDMQRGQLSAQAADRLRLVNDDTKPKLVIILDNTPTPLPVDLLLTETGFQTVLAVGKLVSEGAGFAVLNQANLMALGFSVKEAEKVIKSITSNGPQLPPSIYTSIYGGGVVDHLNLTFETVKTRGGSVVVGSYLDPEETAKRINRYFHLEQIQEALARMSGGVLPLSKRWLAANFPDLFTSETTAYRAIAAVTPTGHCLFQGSKRFSAFLAAATCPNPKTALEALASKPLVKYEGPVSPVPEQPPPLPAND